MGIYINPPNLSKEEFLEQYGEILSFDEWRKIQYPIANLNAVPVVYIDNGSFSALGVAYNRGEQEAIAYEVAHGDTRPKIFATVPASAISAQGGLHPEWFTSLDSVEKAAV